MEVRGKALYSDPTALRGKDECVKDTQHLLHQSLSSSGTLLGMAKASSPTLIKDPSLYFTGLS